MKNIKVLGTGCANCKNTVKLIEEVAQTKRKKIQLEKVERIQDIASYRIMATLGVVIDGRVVHTGGAPSREKVESWF